MNLDMFSVLSPSFALSKGDFCHSSEGEGFLASASLSRTFQKRLLPLRIECICVPNWKNMRPAPFSPAKALFLAVCSHTWNPAPTRTGID